jgi:RimJ/RimL family protein N-acetyltransferase
MDVSLKEQLRRRIRQLREGPAARASWVPVFQYGRSLGWLVPVTRADWQEPGTLELLKRWLGQPGPGSPDRLQFWVRGKNDVAIGLVGLAHFDWDHNRVEIDTAVRGVPRVLPGVMYAATQTLLAWAFQTFAVQEVIVRVAPDNARAMRLYKRCGFLEAIPADGDEPGGAGLTLTRSRSEWMAAHRRDRAA